MGNNKSPKTTVRIPVKLEIEFETELKCPTSIKNMLLTIKKVDIKEALINIDDNEILKECIQSVIEDDVRIEYE